MATQVEPPYIEPTQDPDLKTQTNTDNPDTEYRLGDVEDLTQKILVVIVISVGTLLVAVAAIILDQLHFNNQIYRDGYNPPVQTRYVTQTEIKPVVLKPPIS